jgi:para-nitrobenzyl esterase
MIGRRELLAGVGSAALASALPPKPAGADDGPIATTTNGKVRGATNDGINVFKGIPYGASTAGANRFRPPKPPQPWEGVRDALEYPPMSPQVVRTDLGPLFKSWNFFTNVSEDCLGLNVFTPALRDGAKRPVMVWFHGGDYSILSGATDPDDGTHLCKKGDVVLVTLNHRLNAFGFLYLADLAPEFADSANVGMLDLVAALRWVHDNIAEFGGDPANVTIFGQSGGGGKVSTIMAMPAAAGLFHKAIVQSGSYARNAHLEAMTTETASKHARTFLNALGVAPPDARKLVDTPVDTLIEGLRKAGALPLPDRPVWRPVADGKTLPKGPWWPDAPAMSATVPLMIGTNETEMTMLLGTFDPSTFELDDATMRTRLGRLFAAADIDTVVNAFKATRPNATPSELYFAIVTANSFRRGAWSQADARAAQNAAPVYLYELDWRTPVGGGKWMSPHSLDLGLVFDNVAKAESMVGSGPDAQRLADQMSAAWIAFARTGNPSTSANPKWPPYKPPQRATMVFNVQSKVVDDFRGDERMVLAKLNAHGPFD